MVRVWYGLVLLLSRMVWPRKTISWWALCFFFTFLTSCTCFGQVKLLAWGARMCVRNEVSLLTPMVGLAPIHMNIYLYFIKEWRMYWIKNTHSVTYYIGHQRPSLSQVFKSTCQKASRFKMVWSRNWSTWSGWCWRSGQNPIRASNRLHHMLYTDVSVMVKQTAYSIMESIDHFTEATRHWTRSSGYKN